MSSFPCLSLHILYLFILSSAFPSLSFFLLSSLCPFLCPLFLLFLFSFYLVLFFLDPPFLNPSWGQLSFIVSFFVSVFFLPHCPPFLCCVICFFVFFSVLSFLLTCVPVSFLRKFPLSVVQLSFCLFFWEALPL